MLARASVHLTSVSIARILLPALCLLSASNVFAAETDVNADDTAQLLTKTLPKLENTQDMDRFLSREVRDSFIFEPLPSQNYELNSGPTVADEPVLKQDTIIVPNEIAIQPAKAALVPPTSTDPAATPQGSKVEELPASTANVIQSAPSTTTQQRNALNKSDAINTVWDHIIQSDRLPLATDERVQFYEDQYRRESMWISKILDRGSPFLAHLVAALDQRFMPVELALLPAIESGYLATAKSTGNAAGLWQIVPITAKEIGVRRTAWFDGRGDVLKSTTAAIDYLSYLNSTFDGDWELTLAAYNAGPGRVKGAIRKNEAKGLPTDYWSLNLPRETMNYVPKFIALVSLLKQPDQGGLAVPNVLMEPAFESIDVGFRVSLDKVAKMTNIDEAELRSLNAGLIHGVTPPEGPHHLLIPAGTGERFQQAFANVDRNNAYSEPKTHAVASGDTISSIALKYGLSQRALLAMNGLDDAKIKIGQKLAVLDSRQASESVVEYVVSIGDTLSEIADKFSVNVGDITLSTGEALTSDVIHPGTTLNIIVNLPSSG